MYVALPTQLYDSTMIFLSVILCICDDSFVTEARVVQLPVLVTARVIWVSNLRSLLGNVYNYSGLSFSLMIRGKPQIHERQEVVLYVYIMKIWSHMYILYVLSLSW